MKKLLFLILLLAIFRPFFAQHTHSWADGPLTWDLIEVKPVSTPDQSTYRLGYQLSLEPIRQKISPDSTVIFYQVKGYLQLDKSWVSEGSQTDDNLQVFQASLGYVEKYRRMLAAEVAGKNLSPMELNLLREEYMRRISKDLDRLLEDSQAGTKPIVVNLALQELKEELKSEPSESHLPTYDYQNLNIGLTVMTGLATHFGPLSEYMRAPSMPFGYGFDLGWKRWSLLAMANFTRSQLDQSLDISPAWYAGRGTTGANLNLGIGYRLIDSRHWKVTPSIGFGVNEISLQNPADSLESSQRLVDYGPTLAVLVDYRFKTILKPSERNDLFIRMRLMAGPGSDTDPFRGWSLGCSLGFAFRSWLGTNLLVY